MPSEREKARQAEQESQRAMDEAIEQAEGSQPDPDALTGPGQDGDVRDRNRRTPAPPPNMQP